MQGAFAGTAARIAGGIGIVGCAVVIALAAGGAGMFGGLGSLFGKSGDSLQVAKAGKSRGDIVAAPATAAAQRASVTAGAVPRAQTRHPARNRTPSARPSPQSNPSPPASSQPAPPPAPTLPTPPPPPAPGSGQVASTIAETVKQVAGQAPPQAGPITKPVDDVVDQLVQACQGLPACP